MKTIILKKKIIVFIIIIVVVLTAVILLVESLNKPAQGVISTPQAAAPPTVAYLSESGKTASFQYPTTLHKAKADVLSSGDLEKFAYVSLQVPPWNLNIQIRKLPSGALVDDGSYNLRKTHPEQYHEQKTVINGQNISIMSDQNAGY